MECVGGWDFRAALSSLCPQATPQQGTLPVEEGWYPRVKWRQRRSNTAYKWREMTPKRVTVQMAVDAGS